MIATKENEIVKQTNVSQQLVGLPPQQLERELALRRMDTIQTLMRGNIYLIRTALSHISGKSETLARQLERGDLKLTNETFQLWLEESRLSVDSITEIIVEIERSNMLGRKELSGNISAQELSEILGTTMRGFIRSIRDTRSVNLTFESGLFTGKDFPVPVTTLIDQIAPILLTILGEAVMDGKIFLSSDNDGTDKIFVISFSADLVGRLDLSDLLQAGFGNWAGVENGEVRKIEPGSELIARYNEDATLYTVEMTVSN